MSEYLAQLFVRDSIVCEEIFSSFSDAWYYLYEVDSELRISVPCYFHGLLCWKTIARSATYQGV